MGRDPDPRESAPLASQAAGGFAVSSESLERYRASLRFLARLQIDGRLREKVDASDVVQETFLAAHTSLAQFRGTTEEELRSWLRQILCTKIAQVVRRYCLTEARDLELERRIENELEFSSEIARALVWPGSSPSQRISRWEEIERLAEAVESLPEDYREVILLHHVERLRLCDVAERMGRSVDSVSQLWVRALGRLRQALSEEDHG